MTMSNSNKSVDSNPHQPKSKRDKQARNAQAAATYRAKNLEAAHEKAKLRMQKRRAEIRRSEDMVREAAAKRRDDGNFTNDAGHDKHPNRHWYIVEDMGLFASLPYARLHAPTPPFMIHISEIFGKKCSRCSMQYVTKLMEDIWEIFPTKYRKNIQ
ncbi:hypothetical protein B0H14DRAFT_2586276 [Mycena olivaceomarginata]|nr:hypothetical protein B0H14DRAFT_2586276 [Mycena olivaceomarginata]